LRHQQLAISKKPNLVTAITAAELFARQRPRVGGMVRPNPKRPRSGMSAQEANEIRELTQAELDEVTGAATDQFRGRYQLKLSEASGLLQSPPQK
jgi:hypothetical protein